jgi:hypothetical protein
MTEAKDTIIKPLIIRKIFIEDTELSKLQRGTKKLARSSFNAGIREVIDKIVELKGCYDTKQNFIGILSWDKKEWQAFLKEQGVEK